MAESQDEPSSVPDDSTPRSIESRSIDRSLGYSFDQLSRGSNEVLIEHRGQLYRLRRTRNGKLILNK